MTEQKLNETQMDFIRQNHSIMFAGAMARLLGTSTWKVNKFLEAEGLTAKGKRTAYKQDDQMDGMFNPRPGGGPDGTWII